MEIEQLLQAAFEARQNAYAPYSDIAVGAALLGSDGRIFCGCNVENASYSATLCAERNALAKAVSEGCRTFSALAVAGGPKEKDAPLDTLFFPCGTCRQVLAELCGPDFPIFIAKSPHDYAQRTLGQLLPDAFSL